MTPIPRFYGDCEGPLGFPMKTQQARGLEQLLKALPKEPAYAYRHHIIAKATTELLDGERADVSWISTEAYDRDREIVVAKGMNDSQFALNPLVTLQHAYHCPPVGRSLWRKRVKDGDRAGIKAKTVYPAAPKDWDATTSGPWPADKAFQLVQAALLNGKSIGFLPLKVHYTPQAEAEKLGVPVDTRVIDEWLLLEYACVYLPANQEAIVEAVSKGLLDHLPDPLEEALEDLDEQKGPVPYAGGPKAPKDHPWNAAAARERIKEWAGGADWKPGKYRRAFAYVDGFGSQLSQYKLPHHDVIDGELRVVYHGVTAAMAALHGARSGGMDLSARDRKAVYQHLARHYRQFNESPPDPKELDVEAPDPALVVPFTPVSEIEKAVARCLAGIDFEAIARKTVQEHLERLAGRV
jgi:hypothetical protein